MSVLTSQLSNLKKFKFINEFMCCIFSNTKCQFFLHFSILRPFTLSTFRFNKVVLQSKATSPLSPVRSSKGSHLALSIAPNLLNTNTSVLVRSCAYFGVWLFNTSNPRSDQLLISHYSTTAEL